MQNHRLFSWLLIFAMILQFLIQLQIHVHHEHHSDLVNNETHVIDFHTFSDQHGADEHSDHHEVHELKSTPDFILKKIEGADPGSVLIILLIIFIAMPQVLTRIHRHIPGNLVPRILLYGLSPPKRGPPSPSH